MKTYLVIRLVLWIGGSCCSAWHSTTITASHDRSSLSRLAAAKASRKNKKGITASPEGGFAKHAIPQRQNDGLVIVQISSRPLMFTIDNFLESNLCAHATTSNQALNDVGAFLQQEIACRLFQNQTSANDGLRYNTESYEESEMMLLLPPQPLQSPMFPDGLHMDTNNECSFRHVTCILYLNDVPHGGATVFPLAETVDIADADGNVNNELLVAASLRLLKEKICHTRSCGTVRRSGAKRQADGDFLENFANTGRGIKVQPQVGRLLVFFSRTDDGKEDPRAWHAGERLLPGATNKNIFTLFKEVDYGTNYPSQAETTFEDYLAPQVFKQRQWLETQRAIQKSENASLRKP